MGKVGRAMSRTVRKRTKDKEKDLKMMRCLTKFRIRLGKKKTNIKQNRGRKRARRQRMRKINIRDNKGIVILCYQEPSRVNEGREAEKVMQDTG